MLFGSSSRPILDLIAEARRGLDKKELAEIEAAAKLHKPQPVDGIDFDDHVEAMRTNYLGHQVGRTRSVLVSRYKASGGTMPAVTVNITKETAELRAQVYRRPAWRRLLEDGEYLPHDDERTVAWLELLKHGAFNHAQQEAERVAELVGTSFVKVRWSSTEAAFGRRPRLDLAVYWPSQLAAIYDERAPGRLWASRVVIVYMDRPGSSSPMREVWVRDSEAIGPDGEPLARVGWYFGRYLQDGSEVLPMQRYQGSKLPIYRVASSRCDHHLFADYDRDLLNLQDEINVALSDHWYKASFQSHMQAWISGDVSKKGEKRVIGPASVLELAPGATMGALPSDYDNEKLEGVERMLLLHARANRQPVDAWFTKGGNPETGDAKRIRNQHSDEKRQEHADLYAEMEVTDALPIVADVVDTWAGLGLGLSSLQHEVRFPPPPDFEDRTQKQMRLEKDLDRGVISRARYAVEMGYYVDEASATAAHAAMSAEAAATDGGDATGATLLNGAQVTAMVDLVAAVASGTVPRESAVELAIVGYAVEREVAERLIGPTTAQRALAEDTTL